jgi:fumarate reductase subunit D
MIKLLQKDLLSIAFVASIVVFGSSLVFLLTLEYSSIGRLIFIFFAVASFFSSISLIMQIKEKRKMYLDKNSRKVACYHFKLATIIRVLNYLAVMTGGGKRRRMGKRTIFYN